MVHGSRLGRVRLGVAYVSAILTLVPTILLIQHLGWSPLYSSLLLAIWFTSSLAPILPGLGGFKRYLDAFGLLASIPPIYTVYDYENLIYRAIAPYPQTSTWAGLRPSFPWA